MIAGWAFPPWLIGGQRALLFYLLELGCPLLRLLLRLELLLLHRRCPLLRGERKLERMVTPQDYPNPAPRP